MSTTPGSSEQTNINLPILHEIDLLYKSLYLSRNKIPKSDRFGHWQRIESLTLECFELTLTAAFTPIKQKLDILPTLKIKLEIIKRLVRLAWQLQIINEKKYVYLQQRLVTISKMIEGWIKYLKNKG